MVGVRDPVRARFLVQIGSGAHPASYPMGNEDSFSGDKVTGHEADHSTPTIVEVKNT
jgi:hypothetical protein